MKTPIEVMLQSVQWEEVATPPEAVNTRPDLPWATHQGVLEIGEAKLRCYRLNTGEAMLNADDLDEFLGSALSASEK